MSVLIIGGSGVVGTKLLNHLTENQYNVEFTYLENPIPYAVGHKLDILQSNSVLNLITKINPDVVINTTCLNSVDKCESHPELAYDITVNGMKNIIDACKMIDCKLINISTSFVFDGKKESYDEEDIESPSNNYGLTKFQADELIKKSGLDYLILRTDALYCWIENWQKEKRTNSVLRVINHLNQNKKFNEVIDWYNTPTYVPDLVYLIKLLIEQKQRGIFHISGPEFCNRYEWSLKVAEVFNLDKSLICPIHSDELNLPGKRVNVNLNSSKIINETDFCIKGITEGLEIMKKYFRP
jgi:dTDP-4-dehydrorhamnose reductase